MKTAGDQKIGIIGRVADGVEMYDGRTVTTRIIRNELETRLNTSVFCVDTYDYKHHVFRGLLRSFICLFKCEHIFVLLSNNGRRFFLPFLYYSNKLFHRRVYHRMIGGLFSENVKRHPRWVKYLNSPCCQFGGGAERQMRSNQRGLPMWLDNIPSQCTDCITR